MLHRSAFIFFPAQVGVSLELFLESTKDQQWQPFLLAKGMSKNDATQIFIIAGP